MNRFSQFLSLVVLNLGALPLLPAMVYDVVGSPLATFLLLLPLLLPLAWLAPFVQGVGFLPHALTLINGVLWAAGVDWFLCRYVNGHR